MTVSPPEKSSVWAMSTVGSPLAFPLAGQIVPELLMPTPIEAPIGGLVTGLPQ